MSLVAATEEGTGAIRVVRRTQRALRSASPMATRGAPALHPASGHSDHRWTLYPEVALGVLSLILWALVITISLEYGLPPRIPRMP